MRLQYCAITGADDAVNPTDLADIAKRHPYVEFAILYWPSQMGKPRFPTEEWIDCFQTQCPDVLKSLHLCGEAVAAFSEGDKGVMRRLDGFNRVQLNLGFNTMVDQIDMTHLALQVKALPQCQFIYQVDTRTKKQLHYFDGIDNLALLLDASAGKEIRPETWPSTIPRRFCGYAGGIGPDNVGQVLDDIESITATNEKIWVDMETGVRTADMFDLDKVRSVLEIVGLRQPEFTAKAEARPELRM